MGLLGVLLYPTVLIQLFLVTFQDFEGSK